MRGTHQGAEWRQDCRRAGIVVVIEDRVEESRALAHVRRCPTWGRAAVTVYACTVRSGGEGGRPDYILGDPMANGLEVL